MIGNSADYSFYVALALAVILGLIAVSLFFVSIRIVIRRWRAASLIKKRHYIAHLAFCIGFVNFICGMVIVETFIMGGTARIGKVEQGQFYLGEHGIYTPVSSTTFWICKYYETFVLLIFALSAPAAVITYYMQEEPRETVLDANAFR